LVGTNHIPGTAEAIVVKFCTWVVYVKPSILMTDDFKRGVVRVTWPTLNFGTWMISQEQF